VARLAEVERLRKSVAESDPPGWPEPAAVVQRMMSCLIRGRALSSSTRAVFRRRFPNPQCHFAAPLARAMERLFYIIGLLDTK